MKIIARIGIILVLVGLCTAADAPGFKLTKKYPVPGNGGFDHITFDSSSNRLYVSHGNAVEVLDASSGKRLGRVENTPLVHGIAIVPALHRGFTSNEDDSSVSVFDTNTLKTIKKISVPKGPDSIFYEPLTKRVLISHESAEAITAIDPEKGVLIGKIDLGGGPEGAVVNRKGVGFVNIESTNMVVSFDPRGMAIKQKWPIPGCEAPVPMALDDANSRLFIGCRSKVLTVMDADSGKVITTLPIGDTVDAVVFDSDRKMIFASNGDGTISVIRQKSANEYESVGSIKTQETAKTMAFDPKTKRLFLSAAEKAPPGAQTRFKPGTFRVLVVERQ
jgi:YVTN family beta-propeller protein